VLIVRTAWRFQISGALGDERSDDEDEGNEVERDGGDVSEGNVEVTRLAKGAVPRRRRAASLYS
jgi:hypothetical protein